jgi:hypothetical protein
MFDIVTLGFGKHLMDNLEAVIEKHRDDPQVSCPVYHRFGPGLYIRELHMVVGTIAIGRIQRFEHMNVFIKGKVRVLNPDGTTDDIEAPMTFVGRPGRKVGMVLEDMIWQNIYATDETDIEKLEEMIFVDPSPVRPQPPMDTGYQKFLTELNIDQSQIDREVENLDDQCPMPHNWSNGVVRQSSIDGKGFFVTVPILAGQVIVPARIGGKRTPAGVFINHSDTPNAEMRMLDDGNIYVVALRDFDGCAGGGAGDELVVDYRQSLKTVGRLEELKCQE